MLLRVLLSTQYLIQKILMGAVFDIHVIGLKIKSLKIQILLQCIFHKKRFMKKNTYIGMHSNNPMFLMRP